MDKLDLSKSDQPYYSTSVKPHFITIPAHNFLTIKGVSSPENPAFELSIEAIMSLSYTVKFICKEKGMDYVVPKMEAFWWVKGEQDFFVTPREEWHWKILVRLPDFVEVTDFEKGKKQLADKIDNERLGNIKFEKIEQGRCVQARHTGSYEKEESSIKGIMDFIKENKQVVSGYHHEIYLSDPRKTAEDKLKTILRYEVKPL